MKIKKCRTRKINTANKAKNLISYTCLYTIWLNQYFIIYVLYFIRQRRKKETLFAVLSLNGWTKDRDKLTWLNTNIFCNLTIASYSQMYKWSEKTGFLRRYCYTVNTQRKTHRSTIHITQTSWRAIRKVSIDYRKAKQSNRWRLTTINWMRKIQTELLAFKYWFFGINTLSSIQWHFRFIGIIHLMNKRVVVIEEENTRTKHYNLFR